MFMPPIFNPAVFGIKLFLAGYTLLIWNRDGMVSAKVYGEETIPPYDLKRVQSLCHWMCVASPFPADRLHIFGSHQLGCEYDHAQHDQQNCEDRELERQAQEHTHQL